jgi:hypothetical protein
VKVLTRVLVALVALPLGAWIAVNAFDEELMPEAAQYGEPRPPGVPEADNGYYALLALAAGDGEDGMAYAQAWLAEARVAAAENRLERRTVPKRTQRPDLCDPAYESCLGAVHGNASEVAAQLEICREDIQRYERLIAFRRYEEVLDYPLRAETGFPPYGDVRRAQQAYLARAVLAAEAGNVQDAVAAVERDIAFQRVMLGGARTMLGKVVAATAYWRDLAMIADLLQRRPAEVAPLHARLRAMLQPIDPAALRVSPAIEAEFSFAKHFLEDPGARAPAEQPRKALETIAVALFYKRNASINMEYRRLTALAAAADLPSDRGSAELRTLSQQAHAIGWRDYLYNPVGKVLTRVAAPDHGDDAYHRLRLHDLDAYNRLVGLGVELLAAGVTVDGVAGFVGKSDARFHDPYTEQPMAWDRSVRQLGFTARSRFAAGRKLFNSDKGRVFLLL